MTIENLVTRDNFFTLSKCKKSSHSFLDFLCAVKMPNNQFIQSWFLYLRTLEHLLSGKAWMSLRQIWIRQIRKCRPTFVGSTEGTWEPPIRGSWKDGSPRVGDYHDHQSENSQHLSIERRSKRLDCFPWYFCLKMCACMVCFSPVPSNMLRPSTVFLQAWEWTTSSITNIPIPWAEIWWS